MKQEIVKHALLLSCLLAVLLFSFRISYAHKSAPSQVPFGTYVATICCHAGGTGPQSNDCDPGGGTCTDTKCPEGDIEYPGAICL